MNHSVDLSDWEVVIGLETHVQLMTKTKMFSSIPTTFGQKPNSQAGFIDLALPGTLPKPNKKAIEMAIKFGLAVKGEIAKKTIFARKNYFYPDLPKGYQISQLEHPIVQGGHLIVNFYEHEMECQKVIPLIRAHLEEDAGKSIHDRSSKYSDIDLNRAGIPLLEVVTEPEIKSATQAVAYARALHALVVWLGISDGNMQEGSFRFDVNISVKRKDSQQLGTRVEVKNLNSFRFLEEVIFYETYRQVDLLTHEKIVAQETRLFDPAIGQTRAMRSKENAYDYRYFPDPDLFPIKISNEYISFVKKDMPELPDIMYQRLMQTYGLNEHEASFLITDRSMALFYESILDAMPQPLNSLVAKIAFNWLSGEFIAHLKKSNFTIEKAPITPLQMAFLLDKILNATISNQAAKEVFSVLWNSPVDDILAIDKIITEKGLLQVSNDNLLIMMVETVLNANSKLVFEYKSGKLKALNALIGKAMQLSKGQANPTRLSQLLKKKLDSLG